MWDFSSTAMTFDNSNYFFDGLVRNISVIGAGRGKSGGRVIFNPKKLGERISLTFDFISSLAVNETIISGVVGNVVYSGTDPSPAAMVAGAPIVNGTKVSQGISGGVLGVSYGLTCTILTSLQQTIEINAYLTIESDLP